MAMQLKPQRKNNSINLHLGWIIFILILIIIGILTKQFGNNENIIDRLSFSGTIISILLAVLAIIYSYYQNSTNLSLNHKLISSAEKIEEVTEKIEDTTQLFLDSSSQLKGRLESAVTDIETKICENHEATINLFSNALNRVNISDNNTNNNHSTNQEVLTFIESQADYFIACSSYIGIMVLYACYLALKEKKELNLIKLIQEVFPGAGQESYAYGYLVASSSTGFITIMGDSTDKLIIVQFIESFGEKIVKEAEKRDKGMLGKGEKRMIERFCGVEEGV